MSAAHAIDLPDRIKKAGKLVIATQANYPPIAYKDPESGELMGLDIELGAAIAKELGLKVEYQETSFAQVFSSLATAASTSPWSPSLIRRSGKRWPTSSTI